ncbi:MAG: hypothetical protein WBO73_13515 [Gammaproteobacteria bacterium]|jgi:hypothetical protein
MPYKWLQIRGDPSIREFLFLQERKLNEFDQHLDEVLARVEDLISNYGVFHAKVHFSSGQVSLWLVEDPMRYRVHVKEEFLNIDLYHNYPLLPYTPEAVIDQPSITPILDGFKRLRLKDPQIYLRSGSLNVVNGIVGLNFSCDGSHYMSCTDFLLKVDEIAC